MRIKPITRKIRHWWFGKKIRWVTLFLERHKLYPVNLDKELLEVWKRNAKEK